MNVKKFFDRIWPLAEPELRKEWLLPIAFSFKNFSVKNDGEYLCYLFSIFIILSSTALMAILLLDVYFGYHLFITELVDLSKNKLIFYYKYWSITTWPFLALAFIFYLRIRLTLDIKDNDIPITFRASYVVTFKRARTIRLSIFMIFTGLAISLFGAYIFVAGLVSHFDMQANTLAILVASIIGFYGVSTGYIIAITSALSLEKAMALLSAISKKSFQIHLKPQTSSSISGRLQECRMQHSIMRDSLPVASGTFGSFAPPGMTKVKFHIGHIFSAKHRSNLKNKNTKR
jgi:hypothetical protein